MKKKETTKKRDWLTALFWWDNEDIKRQAEQYDKTPWYKTVRFWLLCFVIGTFVFSAIVLKDWQSCMLLMVMMIPMGYFVMRGYRFSYVFLGLLRVADAAITIPSLAAADEMGQVMSVIIWLGIWLGLCISCYRIETIRRSKKKETKRVSTLDKIFFVVLGLMVAALVNGYVQTQNSPQAQLEKKYGVEAVKKASDIYTSTVVVPELCKDHWKNMATQGGTTYEKLSNNYAVLYFATHEEDVEFVKSHEGLMPELREKLGATIMQNSINSMKKLDASTATIEEAYDNLCRGAFYVLFEAQEKQEKTNK